MRFVISRSFSPLILSSLCPCQQSTGKTELFDTLFITPMLDINQQIIAPPFLSLSNLLKQAIDLFKSRGLHRGQHMGVHVQRRIYLTCFMGCQLLADEV